MGTAAGGTEIVVGAGVIVVGTETGTTTGVEGAEIVTVGAGVAAAAGAEVELELEIVDWLEETLLVWLFVAMVLVAAGAEMTVLVVTLEVVTDPCTHLPLDKMSPNLEEQVLQATPLSL